MSFTTKGGVVWVTLRFTWKSFDEKVVLKQKAKGPMCKKCSGAVEYYCLNVLENKCLV